MTLPRGVWPTQVSVDDFVAFVKQFGVTYKRTSNGHDHYDREKNPLARPMTLRCNERFVPATHIQTNLRLIGKTRADIRRWLSQR